jgi:hypothetical protein
MRKLILILIALIAAATFVRAAAGSVPPEPRTEWGGVGGHE